MHYRDVYPGIDLAYYGNEHALEYDFVVAPGADPGAIRIAFEGAGRPEVDSDGHLLLHLAGGVVRQLRPGVYQEIDGARRPVDARYVLRDGRVGFDLAAYDPAGPVVIDPVIVYSTYPGGADRLGPRGARRQGQRSDLRNPLHGGRRQGRLLHGRERLDDRRGAETLTLVSSRPVAVV